MTSFPLVTERLTTELCQMLDTLHDDSSKVKDVH